MKKNAMVNFVKCFREVEVQFQIKQSGHVLNPSEETGTGCPVTSKYGGTPPNKHGGVG